ncbi:hypothetical protein [Jejuia pallidilutea]|uniref:hypothetical protein n=1 Tax=Jejuia pallidilutea TaxID=504487 RepID=UPI001EE6C377|nr:hypothetical protein [Jejuia pallidilutea]
MMFITFAIFSGIDDAIDGCNGLPYNSDNGSDLFSSYFGNNAKHLFNILSIVGMIVYIMSKEKIEDDYINILRLESYQLTTLIFLFAGLIIYIISENILLTVDYYIELFLIIYLVVFFIKKRIY